MTMNFESIIDRDGLSASWLFEVVFSVISFVVDEVVGLELDETILRVVFSVLLWVSVVFCCVSDEGKLETVVVLELVVTSWVVVWTVTGVLVVVRLTSVVIGGIVVACVVVVVCWLFVIVK